MNKKSKPSKNKSALNVPMILTLARIFAIPLVVLCFFVEGRLETLDRSSDFTRWLAFSIFIAASISDFLDGYLARIWKQTTRIGKMLDPIADKLLVAACLLLLSADGTIAGWATWAAIIILCREILVSGLREYLAELTVSVPVTRLAKYKTTIQMFAIGFLLVGPAGYPLGVDAINIGIGLLWCAAIVTLYTGYDYLKASLRHVN